MNKKILLKIDVLTLPTLGFCFPAIVSRNVPFYSIWEAIPANEKIIEKLIIYHALYILTRKKMKKEIMTLKIKRNCHLPISLR